MYYKEFEIRWSDMDANMHLANSSYINFMSHTRMSFLIENRLSYAELKKHNIGPVAFYEHIYYFKEVFAGSKIKVSLQLKGMSEDGMYFEFLHNFYDAEGNNVARCNMLGGWIDMKARKLVGLSEEFLERFSKIEKSKDFKILTKEDTRLGIYPENLAEFA
ncbi:MAG TPA: thioesterase family protein [Flavobacteriaceae bacterium]|nr:thioesterase family protein [Flavobacteriaceae bacterium]